MSKFAQNVFAKLDMLANGSGLFRVAAEKRLVRERQTLEKHPWRSRLESLLRQAESHGADWVYFRMECEAGGPKAEVFVYDQTTSLADSPGPFDVAQLQLELWNYGKVPLAFVLRPTGVEIYNLLTPPEFGPNGLSIPQPLETLGLSPAETLAKAGAVAKAISEFENEDAWLRFSGPRFDNGGFWEAPENRALGSSDRSSMAAMVQEMRTVRKLLENRFSKDSNLPEELARHSSKFVHRLLILTLMVRFMEEREILPPGYFDDKACDHATNFKSLLGKPKPLLNALDRLAKDFNGDIFKISDDPDDVPMRSILRDLVDHETALQPLAFFADGQMEGEQRHFWERYSFRHLPVETISYVYEDFLGGKSQAFFTPHHLVDLLLDEAMPAPRVREAFEKAKSNQKQTDPIFPVLDPACGSGVFLVGAWQRLIEAQRLTDPNPSPERLKQLMEENIHGVDIETDSVELTIFSLCVALCGTFPTKDSDPEFTLRKLKELKFPNLKSSKRIRRNIDCGDFFVRRKMLISNPLRFRAIVGNPPFKDSSLTPDARIFDEVTTDEDQKKWPAVPDGNIAYLFLRAIPPLLAPEGRACLVQNAGLLYNQKPAAFRKALFQNWHIPAILDFASISSLFKTRKARKNSDQDSESSVGVKTVAVIMVRQEPNPEGFVLHVTFRRTFALEEREAFEVDPQDMHWIPWKLASSEPRIWKANLLGGGRLFDLYKTLTSCESLADRTTRLQKSRNWVVSEGLIVADNPTDQESFEEIIEKKKLKNRPQYSMLDLLETEGLSNDSINDDQVAPCGIEWFLRPREERLFAPPHLLVKEHETFPMALRMKGKKLLFRDKIVGFAVPDTETDREELRRLHEFLKANRRAAKFFAAFGPQYLIFRMGTPLKKSLMDLPYPENGKILFQGVQKHFLDDVLNFMIPLIKDNQQTRAELANDAGPKIVKSYSGVFQKVLGSAFPDLKVSGEPVDLGRAWCIGFHRGDTSPEPFGDPEVLREHLDSLLIKEMGRSLRCSRIVRHFHGKTLFVLKPKPRRYWLKSAAVRDADEMFAWWAAQSASHTKPKA